MCQKQLPMKNTTSCDTLKANKFIMAVHATINLLVVKVPQDAVFAVTDTHGYPLLRSRCLTPVEIQP